jgi:uncharacterized protein YuzE
MKITYYTQSDILYIELSDAPIGESQNVGEYTNATFTPEGVLRSIEILNAAAHGLMVDTVQTQYIANETVNAALPDDAAMSAGRRARAEAVRAARAAAEKAK